MTFRKRGGRKLVVMPDGAPWALRPRVDNAMVKALAQAFRWQRMLDAGGCTTVKDLAERERVNPGYMSRVLRLTLLAPDIVEAILDGREPEGMRLGDILNPFPAAWVEQRNLHTQGSALTHRWPHRQVGRMTRKGSAAAAAATECRQLPGLRPTTTAK
jgi:hypothetical protein